MTICHLSLSEINRRYGSVFAEHHIALVKELGRGKEAVVLQAKQTLKNGYTIMDYAVKFYQFGLGSQLTPGELRKQFHAYEQLQHQPAFVKLHDLIEHPEFTALVLELGEKSLQSVIDQEQGKGIPRSTVCEWLAPVAGAIDAAHLAFLYHSDIKPSNMLLCFGGQIKITDFGSVESGDSATTKRHIFATKEFLIPDWQKRSRRDIDFYAFAVSYAYARLGRLPFKGRTPLFAEIDLLGLESDEVEILLPILTGEIPESLTCSAWIARLRPAVITQVETFYDRATQLVDRVDARRWWDDYRPDQRDIDDVREAKRLLDAHEPSLANSHEFHGLRSRVLTTLADLLAPDYSKEKEAKRLFDDAWDANTRAVELGPDVAAYWAHRAALRFIAAYEGSHVLPLMFVVGDRIFDATNSPFSSNVKWWHAELIAASLSDITHARELDPTPKILSLRALLLSLRAILLFVGKTFEGTESITKRYRIPVTMINKSTLEESDGWYQRWYPAQAAFDESVHELTYAIETCRCSATRASLYIQRAWTRAGFGLAIWDDAHPVNGWMRDLGDSIAFSRATDKFRERVNVKTYKYRRSLSGALSDLTKAEREIRCAKLRMPRVIAKKQLSYSLWNAFDFDVQMADLLGLLPVRLSNSLLLGLIAVCDKNTGYKEYEEDGGLWDCYLGTMNNGCIKELRSYLEEHTKVFEKSHPWPGSPLERFFSSGPRWPDGEPDTQLEWDDPKRGPMVWTRNYRPMTKAAYLEMVKYWNKKAIE